MHVLLTGASSFIGGHLATAFASQGIPVTATYRRANHIVEGLQRSCAGKRVELVSLDLTDARAVTRLPSQIDAVIHVAGVSAATDVSIDDMLACNVAGAHNILRYALAAGASRLIYLSTLSVHGRIDANVVDENTPVIDPDFYGASKYLAERLMAATAAELPAVAIRLPGVLGRGAHRAWLPTLLQRIRRSEPFTIYNPDAPFNNAVHVADLGMFCMELLERTWQGFHAMPVGAAGHITVRAAVTQLMAAAGSTTRITISPASRPGFTISSDRAIRHFGYRPLEIGAMLDRYVMDELSGDQAN
jgi:UDP-glucose 4-epimerase